MFALEHVSWHVGGVSIVDDVSLDVRPDEVVAVIGPNGAGKTSLFNLASGLTRPSAGRVLLGGVDVTRLPAYRRARLGLGRTFQSSAGFGSLPVVQNVCLAVQSRRGGSMRAFPRRRDREVVREAERVLAGVGLAERSGVLAGTLAHGERRKLEIALLLAAEPRVLLLDEPMAGLGVEDVPALVETIRSGGTGRAVLLVEHHMDVVLELADRVAVLHHGALLACDTPAAVMADPAVQGAYLGERP